MKLFVVMNKEGKYLSPEGWWVEEPAKAQPFSATGALAVIRNTPFPVSTLRANIGYEGDDLTKSMDYTSSAVAA